MTRPSSRTDMLQLDQLEALMPDLESDRVEPIFMLAPSDGAMGGYAAAVFDARRELRDLARALARRVDVALPSSDASEPREEKR